MRALTHRRAKTPWTDDEKSLINEVTAITDLPNKNDVKDKAQVLQGKYKMTFTDDPEQNVGIRKSTIPSKGISLDQKISHRSFQRMETVFILSQRRTNLLLSNSLS